MTAMLAPVAWFGCASLPAGSGERIAFIARDGAFWQAFVMSADGTRSRQLTHSPVEKSRLSWFPDGAALLVNTQEGHLLRVDAASGAEEVVPLPVHGMLDAVLSPDGARVAFSLTQSDSPDANEIWVCGVDGTGLRQLTNRAGLQHSPFWDPRDPEVLYYLSDHGPGGRHDIWRMRVDVGSDEQVTFGDLRYLDVAVSGRGELAYSGNQSGSYDLWLKAPGASPVRLTADGALDARPSFSPDGDALVFESARGGSLNLWRVDRKGGPAVRLTQLPPPGARMPVWSPAETTR